MADEMHNLPARVAGVNQPERIYTPLGRAVGPRGPAAYDAEPAGQGFSLREILYVLFRHKWKIVFTSLLLSGLVIFVIVSMAQLYEAEGRVLIRGERTGVVVDPTGEGNTFLKAARDTQSSVRSEIGVIKSYSLAEQVVNALGPDGVLGQPPKNGPKTWAESLGAHGWVAAALGGVERGYDAALRGLHLEPPKLTRKQAAVSTIMRGLDVMPNMTESYVLLVTYRATDPQRAQRVLDALLDAYQQQHIKIHKTQVSPEFFQGKITELKTALDEKESLLDAERKRLKVSSLEAQKTLLLTKFNTYDTALKDNAMRITSLKAKIGELEQLTVKRTRTGKDGKRVVPVRTNPYVDQLRGRLVELKLKESDLALRFTDRNPDLIDVRNQIRQIEGMIKGEAANKDSGIDLLSPADSPQMDMEVQVILAKAELQAETARESMLIKEMNAAQADLNTLMEHEKDLKALERDVQLLEADYKQYKNSQQTAVISDTLDRDKISNVSIVQAATLPTAPVKSQRKLLALLGFGLFMSVGAALAWAFALEFCDHSIKTSEEVERSLGLPVLVAIPHQRHHKALLQKGGVA